MEPGNKATWFCWQLTSDIPVCVKHEPDVLAECDTVIKTQLHQGIVEPVDDQSSVDVLEYTISHTML